MLSHFPFDSIKVDRLMTAQILPEAPPPPWLLTGIVALIRTSEITVIAEGVETAHQVQVLMEQGIQAVQGFHFSPPLWATGLITFLARPTVMAPAATSRRSE